MIPVLGGESRRVIAVEGHDGFHPFFSRSERWLYFQLDHKNIYRVPGPAQHWRAAEPEQITHFAGTGLFLEDPQLSLDGKHLLLSHGHRTGDLWLMNLGDVMRR